MLNGIYHDPGQGGLPIRRGISLGAVAESFSGKLADIVLPESGGAQVRLGSLWENNPAAIVFLRHYG